MLFIRLPAPHAVCRPGLRTVQSGARYYTDDDERGVIGKRITSYKIYSRTSTTTLQVVWIPLLVGLHTTVDSCQTKHLSHAHCCAACRFLALITWFLLERRLLVKRAANNNCCNAQKTRHITFRLNKYFIEQCRPHFTHYTKDREHSRAQL